MSIHKVYSYRQDEVEIPDNPQRLVSFSPSITEILFELGLSEQIVGIKKGLFCKVFLKSGFIFHLTTF